MSRHWEFHPHVRTGADLTFGERAADVLKHWFGTWTILGVVAAFITFWLAVIFDPGDLHLNLILSCMAAVQGIILQISANRGDRISAEVAKGTHENTSELLEMNRRQLEILTELRELRAAVEDK